MTKLGRAFVAVVIFTVALVVYRSNGYENFSGDTLATSLLTFNVVENGTYDLERFRSTYAKAPGMTYAFFSSPTTGRLTSAFPIGSAILTLPICAYFDRAMRAYGQRIDITDLGFESRRLHYEKEAASIVAALSVALFFLCVRLFVAPVPSVLSTIAYGFGTGVWAMNSQNLYQHGPSNLAIIFLIICCAMAARTRGGLGWLLLAGLCAGFMLVIRPTNVFYAIAAAAFVLWRFRGGFVPFALAAAMGYAPGLAWDLYFFGRPVGGYPTQTAAAYIWDLRAFTSALAGLLGSPNRGLFVFSPVLLGAFAGAFCLRVRAHRADDVRLVALMSAGAVAMACSYGFYNMWWGGFSYGPRFLIDTVPVLCLLLAFAFPNAVLSVLLCVSVLIEAFGAYAGAAGSSWNSVPVNVDEHHDRIWQTRDGEIERYARSTYFVIVGNPAVKAGYAGAFAGRVESVAAGPAPFASKIEVRAKVRNTGTVPWYGYPSGVYLGQARVETKVRDRAGKVVAQGYLYVDGNPRPGASATALADFAVPDASASYLFDTKIVPFGNEARP
jgi:MFS family permease